MPKSRYYRLLGLSENASQTEIRKQYRMLAMRYHPDKNPDPNAEVLFIQITEAYEVLTGKREAAAPGLKTKPRTSTKEEKEERVRQARARYTEQILKEKFENERYFRYLTQGRKWKTIRWTAIIGMAISALLVLDLFLPHHYDQDEVSHYSVNVGHGPSGQRISLIKTVKGDSYWISRMTYSLYGKTRHIFVESSWIFHNPIRIISQDKIVYKYFNPHFTFYNGMWILIAALMIPFVTIRFKRKSVGFTLLYHISYYGISIIILYFLITGDRWAHLLTLGYF